MIDSRSRFSSHALYPGYSIGEVHMIKPESEHLSSTTFAIVLAQFALVLQTRHPKPHHASTAVMTNMHRPVQVAVQAAVRLARSMPAVNLPLSANDLLHLVDGVPVDNCTSTRHDD